MHVRMIRAHHITWEGKGREGKGREGMGWDGKGREARRSTTKKNDDE